MASDIKATWWIADGIDGKVENQGAQALLDLVTWGDVDREILRHILESPFLVSVEPPAPGHYMNSVTSPATKGTTLSRSFLIPASSAV